MKLFVHPSTKLLVILSASLFVAEAIVMLLLEALPTLPPLRAALLDATLLVLLTFPAMRAFAFQPLIRHLRAREAAETMLEEANRTLEQRVQERTRELQTAHETLSESEERFRDLFENATDLIQIVSPDGRFAFVNRAWKHALGYTDEERSNLTAFDIVDGSSKEHCTDAFRRLMNGEDVPVVEAVFVGKQGRRIMVEGHVSCRRLDGTPGNTRGIFRDVTARKEAEKTLQRMRDQHALILNSVSEGVHGLDLEGQVTFENPASAAMLGYETPDLINRPAHATIHHTRPDGTAYPPSECPIHASLKDGVVRHVRDEVFWRKDGTSFPVDYTSAPLREKDGTIVGATVVFTDITERKRTQAELENMHKQLVDASRQAGMAEVATNVLHNVGNVLNSVNISTGVLVETVKKSRASSLSRVVTLLQEHRHDLGAFITRDARGQHLPAHLATLSEHLQAEQAAIVSEIESLRRNVEHIKDIVAMQQSYAAFGAVRQAIDVASLVEDSLRMNEDAFSRHRVEVIREFEPVPPLVLEKHKLLQILVNLLSNAKSACDRAGRMDHRVTVRVANGDGRVRISVMDNGIGIPPENLTRVFNHGFTTRPGGHGFGLHSSALAAKELGGSLIAHSAGPGQGATFTLEMPILPEGN